MNGTTVNLTFIGIKCPRCGAKFLARQLPPLKAIIARDSELRLLPDEEFGRLEAFAVSTCPGCNKSDWTSQFEPVIDEIVSVPQGNIPPHLQYRQAAIEADRSHRGGYAVATLFMYAAWCADDVMAVPQAREYRRQAADYFRKCLSDGSCPKPETLTVQYLIGELLRRSSQFHEATQHFREILPQMPMQFATMTSKLLQLAEMRNMEPMLLDV